jgi:hypothetical protein
MSFILFLLVTAALFIRPSEQFAELRNVNLYQTLIIPCFLFSLGGIFEQFSPRSLDYRPITVCVLGLLAAVVLSHVSNGNASLAVESSFEFIKVLVYYVLLVANITTMARLRVFIFSIVLFASAFVTLSVLQYHDIIPAPNAEPLVTTNVVEKTLGSEAAVGAYIVDVDYDPVTGQNVEFRRLRGTGIFKDPNDLCLLLTMSFFICLYGVTDRRQGNLRILWLVPIALFMYALQLTQSRGGLLSLLAGCFALIYGRWGWRTALALGLPLVPVALVLFGGRMASFSATEGTGQTRVQIWSDAFAAMRTQPLFGVGMNESGAVVGKAAHNSFLHAYAELGFFGGTLFFAAFFFAVVLLNRMLTYRQCLPDPELRRALPFLLALVGAYIVGILSLSRIETVPTYLLLALVTAASLLASSKVPLFAVRLDTRLLQRMVVASISFLALSYLFIRVVKV